MDLMSGSTSFSALEKKYEGMNAPSFRIKVDGVELVTKLKCAISDLEVDLTSGFESSGCSFTVIHEYDPEKSEFRSDGAVKSLQVGAAVEVEIGYIKMENVFSGYVMEVDYVWDDDEELPEIQVSCADAKCLMMKSQRMEILAEQKLSDAIGAVLGQAPASAYMKGKQVDSISLKDEIFRLPMESDYDFLVRYAKYTGCEFFIIQGKAYFRKIPPSPSVIMTLSLKDGLLGARVSQRGGKLVNKITVSGIDPETGKAVSGQAQAKGKFSEGASGSKSINATERNYFDETIKNAAEAGDRAKVLMQYFQQDFMVMEGRCLGIPELVPGRGVTIKKLAPAANKTWYIQHVRHTIDDRGFLTTFEARMDSL